MAGKESKKMFNFFAGAFLLTIGSMMFLTAVGSISLSILVSSLEIPFMSDFFSDSLVIGVIYLCLAGAMTLFGIKMLNNGIGAFKNIIYLGLGLLFSAIGIIVGIAAIPASTPFGLAILIAGIGFIDYSSGANVAKNIAPNETKLLQEALK